MYDFQLHFLQPSSSLSMVWTSVQFIEFKDDEKHCNEKTEDI